MYTRMKKGRLAVMAAAIASASLATSLPATASPAKATRSTAITTVIDTNFAGYVTGANWRFRYITAEVTMAGCRSAANQNAVASIALMSGVSGDLAHIDLHCGGGHGSVMFGTGADAEGHFQLSPGVGDVLRISIFRDSTACRDEFTATNTRTRNTKQVLIATSCQVVYRHAQPGATLTSISGTWSPPVANVRLWEFRNIGVTSYNGTRGTICGPWSAEKHLAAPVITVRMIPTALPASCRDFDVLLKGTG